MPAPTAVDVRAACDVLSPVYRQTAGTDGRVFIEVDPRLARDAAATADMARALRSAVDRDNMFVKIPATPRRPHRYHAGHQRGHQRQRDPDLRPRPVPRGHGRLPQ